MTARRRTLPQALNFLVTNRLPRRLATRVIGRISKVEAWPVAPLALLAWKSFCDVDLSDAAEPRFRSLHQGFTRALRPGARSFDSDPGVLCSPCDAILGAHGVIVSGRMLQVKGMPYTLGELAGEEIASRMEGGFFATLRLTAGMYHRFHAPADLTIEAVTHIPGDCWNVNPPALARVAALYCRNERATISARLADGSPLLLVPVAAVLVAGIRLHALGLLRGGASFATLALTVRKGDELGWFEHGSTIVLLAPPGYGKVSGTAEDDPIRAGQPLLHRA
ncbi:MAG: archaetidylserine decarboxylase [Novosphingobium sp.]